MSNRDAFIEILEAERAARHKTWSQVAREAGLPRSTVSRLLHGSEVYAGAVWALWDWLDAQTAPAKPEPLTRERHDILARILIHGEANEFKEYKRLRREHQVTQQEWGSFVTRAFFGPKFEFPSEDAQEQQA